MKLLPGLAMPVVLMFAACGTTYVKPPSTSALGERVGNVRTRVSSAQVRSETVSKRVTAASVKTKASQEKSKAVTTAIDAARESLRLQDYVAADKHLVEAKLYNEFVLAQYNPTLEDLAEAKAEVDSLRTELSGAMIELDNVKKEKDALQLTIDKMATTTAGDSEIARRCKSWFGLGAIFYGVERLLKAGILGILILGVAAVALFFVAKLVGGPFAGVIMGIFSKARAWWKRRKPPP